MADDFERAARDVMSGEYDRRRGRPLFAVRLARGLVTHWHGQPLTSFEMADDCRRKIEEELGESGEVEHALIV